MINMVFIATFFATVRISGLGLFVLYFMAFRFALQKVPEREKFIVICKIRDDISGKSGFLYIKC